MLCARVVNLAHDTSIEGDISHRSIAGTVEDVPDACIITITPTDLEEVCMFHMRTTSLCKNKRSEICIFRHFCIWGSSYANFSCTKCELIPICKSPYANEYCSNTPKTNFLRIWDPCTHNEIVCIWVLTYT